MFAPLVTRFLGDGLQQFLRGNLGTDAALLEELTQSFFNHCDC